MPRRLLLSASIRNLLAAATGTFPTSLAVLLAASNGGKRPHREFWMARSRVSTLWLPLPPSMTQGAPVLAARDPDERARDEVDLLLDDDDELVAAAAEAAPAAPPEEEEEEEVDLRWRVEDRGEARLIGGGLGGGLRMGDAGARSSSSACEAAIVGMDSGCGSATGAMDTGAMANKSPAAVPLLAAMGLVVDPPCSAARERGLDTVSCAASSMVTSSSAHAEPAALPVDVAAGEGAGAGAGAGAGTVWSFPSSSSSSLELTPTSTKPLLVLTWRGRLVESLHRVFCVSCSHVASQTNTTQHNTYTRRLLRRSSSWRFTNC